MGVERIARHVCSYKRAAKVAKGSGSEQEKPTTPPTWLGGLATRVTILTQITWRERRAEIVPKSASFAGFCMVES